MNQGFASRTHRIVIVDDHPIVRAGLTALIGAEADLEVCGHAADPAEALRVVELSRPDLVLVDLSLGDASGLDLVKRLAERQLATLVVSVHKDPIWAERSLAAGARGYVHKGEASNDVVSAIRSVIAGRAWVSPSISVLLLGRRVGVPVRDQSAHPVELLSNRELEVFERIGQGLSTRQIGEALGLSRKTVQTHRERIKAKLSLGTAAELAAQAARWVSERASG
ncbi:MAG: response regulator transcription factor [Burkholderiaceae bacterium]|nr:response regulator transcription factor [Burkholderiaceae bacterium]